MALSLYAANEGYLDDVEVGKVVSFESAMQAYIKSSHGALMDEINEHCLYNDEVDAQLSAALDDFKKNGSW